MSAEAAASAPAGAVGEGLVEARRLHWRRRVSDASLRRDGRRWTLWTAGVVVSFGAPAAAVLMLDPWLFPVAVVLLAHAWLICRLQAGRGVTSVVPLGSRGRGPGSGRSRLSRPLPEADAAAEGTALGLLGDLLGHGERELLAHSGLAMQRGRLGVWLLGEQGALLVRGGRRIFSYCVRVGESEDLPAGDRVAHLLLALREDEEGFATVANLGFSGAVWRCRLRMSLRQRPALDAARAAALEMPD
jgi:hypothetical protein